MIRDGEEYSLAPFWYGHSDSPPVRFMGLGERGQCDLAAPRLPTVLFIFIPAESRRARGPCWDWFGESGRLSRRYATSSE